MVTMSSKTRIRIYAGAVLVVLCLAVVIVWLDWSDPLRHRGMHSQWYREQKSLASSSEKHLRHLAALAVDFTNTQEWQRRCALQAVSALVRLPGEPIEFRPDPADSQRWKRVVEALSSESATLHFESQAGVWVVDYAGGMHREESEEAVNH
jgi:hypothetical protein